MSTEIQKSWIDECRKQGLPVVVNLAGESFFAVKYICENFLMIEKDSDFSAKCRESGVQMLIVNKKPCIRMSDAIEVCRFKPPKNKDGVSDSVPVPKKGANTKPRTNKKARG